MRACRLRAKPMDLHPNSRCLESYNLCRNRAPQHLQVQRDICGFALGREPAERMLQVQGFREKRDRLLPLASAVQALPPEVKQTLESPASRYNFGYSCGRETLEGGLPDTYKAGAASLRSMLRMPTSSLIACACRRPTMPIPPETTSQTTLTCGAGCPPTRCELMPLRVLCATRSPLTAQAVQGQRLAHRVPARAAAGLSGPGAPGR